MKIKIKEGEFILRNKSKVERVIDGAPNSSGKMQKGIGKEAKPEYVIAMYDKLGGAIKGEEGADVEMGSFYDFEKEAPRTKVVIKKDKNGKEVSKEEVFDFDVTYVFKFGRKKYKMKVGDKESLELKAARAVKKAEAAEAKKEEAKKKVKK